MFPVPTLQPIICNGMYTYNNQILPETKCHQENLKVNLNAICIIQIQMIVINITMWLFQIRLCTVFICLYWWFGYDWSILIITKGGDISHAQ